MIYAVELHPLALQDLHKSYSWYEERSIGLGARFLDAIENRFTRLEKNPQAYAKKKGAYREIPVTGFPFVIIYEIHEAEKKVLVTDIFHTRRDPTKKHKRD